MSKALGMPRWTSRYKDEAAYNEAAAERNGWLLQDQKWLTFPDGARVEPCDLLTAQAQFIHVKDGDRASAVHHQLGQLSGAASLLSRDPATIAELESRFAARWPGRRLTAFRPAFVLAVGRRQDDKGIFGKMLLPKINTLEHARRVRALGYDFAVCRIEMPG